MDRLFDVLDEGSWDWDLPAGTVRHNLRWCAIAGTGPQATSHDVQAWRACVHPDDASRVQAHRQQGLADGVMPPIEYRLRRPDGAAVWVVDRGAVLERDPAGQPLRMAGAVRDVTEARRARLALEESAQRLRLALRSGDLGLWDWDLATGRLVVDERWKTMLGLPPDAPVDGIATWDAHVHPDDKAVLQAVVQRVFESPGGRDFSVEVRARHADGHWLWILDQGIVAARDADGRCLRVTGTHQDVSARKAAERALRLQQEQLRAFVASTLDAMLSVDAELRLVVFNPAAQRLFGIAAAQAVGRPLEALLPLRLRPRARQLLARAVRGGPRRLRLVAPELRPLHSDGSAIPAEVAVATLPPESGQWLTLVVRDLGQELRAEQVLREREEARQASRAKDVLLSRVSHELRTPLNAVLGFAELVEQAAGEPAVRRHAGLIRQAGSRLLDLVNALLDLSKVEAGALSLALRPVPVAAQVGDVCALLEQEALGREVLLTQAPIDEALHACADPRALDQILLNLVSNALKFTPAGGRVTLRAARDGATVALDVEDSGQGMDLDAQAHLFEPFNRLGARSHATPGWGLGLAISQELALAMGGSLRVWSRKGEGTRVTLVLPLAEAPPQAVPAAGAGTAEAADGELPAPAGGDIVLVEDDRLSALLMQQVVQLAPGWRLRVAPDLASAARLLAEAAPQLLLVDVNVGRESGIEFVRSLRDWPQRDGVTVVAVSADALDEQIGRARQAGADGYWIKPITPSQLVRFLQAGPARWPGLLKPPV